MNTPTEKGNWLSVNIVPIIALTMLGFTISVIIIVLVKGVRTTENTTFLILSFVNSATMLVLGYYFGSTKGSQQKTDTISKMAESKT